MTTPCFHDKQNGVIYSAVRHPRRRCTECGCCLTNYDYHLHGHETDICVECNDDLTEQRLNAMLKDTDYGKRDE